MPGQNMLAQSNFSNLNIDRANSSLARSKFKSQLLSTIISMECNSLSANFISAKSLLIRGEILVPTPNISSVCPISPNCRGWQVWKNMQIIRTCDNLHPNTMNYCPAISFYHYLQDCHSVCFQSQVKYLNTNSANCASYDAWVQFLQRLFKHARTLTQDNIENWSNQYYKVHAKRPLILQWISNVE